MSLKSMAQWPPLAVPSWHSVPTHLVCNTYTVHQRSTRVLGLVPRLLQLRSVSSRCGLYNGFRPAELPGRHGVRAALALLDRLLDVARS